MKRHGEPDIPRPCVKGWNSTFPFSPTASSLRSFVSRILALCDMAKKFTHCHTRTNQPCLGEKKRPHDMVNKKRKKKNKKTTSQNETRAFFLVSNFFSSLVIFSRTLSYYDYLDSPTFVRTCHKIALPYKMRRGRDLRYGKSTRSNISLY